MRLFALEFTYICTTLFELKREKNIGGGWGTKLKNAIIFYSFIKPSTVNVLSVIPSCQA